jgi:hypothetical protein
MSEEGARPDSVSPIEVGVDGVVRRFKISGVAMADFDKKGEIEKKARAQL